MRLSILFAAGALAVCLANQAWAQERVLPAGSDVVIRDCLVTLIKDLPVPAEEAGVLKAVNVGEGDVVKIGTVLANIDDSRVRMQAKVAEMELEVAKAQAKDDIDIKYAEARAKVSKAEYQLGLEARERVEGALSDTEMRRRKLQYESSRMAIDRASRDFKVAGINADVARVKLEAANKEIGRREVVAPFNGVVAKINRKNGEWVSPGDSIMRLVQMDTLRVEGFVNASQFSQFEVINKPVTVKVKLARGQEVTLSGRIGYTSPEVEATGEFRVWAEIKNKHNPERGYLVHPGRMAEMTLHM